MSRISVAKTVQAGLLAGVLFYLLETVLVPIGLGGSPWAPPRTISSIVLGQGVLPPPASFDLGIVLVGLIVNLVLSVAYAFVIAFAIAGRSQGVALLIGAAAGLALYLINFYVFTGIFPQFAGARNWVTVVAHLAFGLLAALFYVRFTREQRELRPASG